MIKNMCCRVLAASLTLSIGSMLVQPVLAVGVASAVYDMQPVSGQFSAQPVTALRLGNAANSNSSLKPVGDQAAAQVSIDMIDAQVQNAKPSSDTAANAAPANAAPASPAMPQTAPATTASATSNAPQASTNPSSGGSDADLATNFNTPISALTQEQRLSRLEQQVTNLINLGQAQKINSLREQVQAVMGQLEVVQHDLKQLNRQQRGFYQNLDQRINHLQTLSVGGSAGARSSAGASGTAAGSVSGSTPHKAQQ